MMNFVVGALVALGVMVSSGMADAHPHNPFGHDGTKLPNLERIVDGDQGWRHIHDWPMDFGGHININIDELDGDLTVYPYDPVDPNFEGPLDNIVDSPKALSFGSIFHKEFWEDFAGK